jgi:hypothetical protein
MKGRAGVRWLIVMASVVMVAAVAAGLYVVGSPAHQRAVQLDQRRQSDLMRLAASIHRHWSQYKVLPADLQAVDPGRIYSKDPVRGTPYEYVLTGSGGYRLCAVFDAASESDGVPVYTLVEGGAPLRRDHPAGKSCFDFSP